VSRRPRWAAVASALALLAAYGATSFTHAQAANQVMTDPAGDATSRVAANGGTTGVPNEPRADITTASASYETGAIVLSVQAAQPVNPATDAGWGTSDVTWFLDTTGDKKFDYSIEFGADAGSLYADVYDTANTVICHGTPSLGSDGSYIVSLDPKCFKSPRAFYWGGRTEWALAGTTDQIMDRFPDGDGNYWGPVAPGSTTPPPTTPTTVRPGGGPAPIPTTTTTIPFRPIVTTPVESNQGFWLLGRDGGIFSFGTAGFYGSIGNVPLQKQIVSMAAKPDSTGYWFVGSDGSIYAYKAPFWGSTSNVRLNKPIVGMAATPTGQGYWMVASDGGIFAFGDAKFYGSTGAINLNKPIVGMATTPTGRGYWLVASDGGIFAFGDAPFYGSTGSLALNQPIAGMASSPTGKGYWFVANDGGIFAFGDAGFFGSAANGNPVPVVGMAATKTGMGYRVVRADGSVLAFGSAGLGGGLTGTLSSPIVGITTAF
jgi:ribosomal protein L24E